MQRLFYIKKSPIHGSGVFAKQNIHANTVIDTVAEMSAVCRWQRHWLVTPHFGKWINHSYLNANTKVDLINKKYVLRAIREIPAHQEILADYTARSTPNIFARPDFISNEL